MRDQSWLGVVEQGKLYARLGLVPDDLAKQRHALRTWDGLIVKGLK